MTATEDIGSELHERAERFGEESHRLAAAAELEQLHRRAVAGCHSGNLVAQRSKHIGRELEDFVSGPVAQLQWFDFDVVELQLLEHVSPIAEAIVQMELLGDVTGERDRLLLRRRVEHDRQLDWAHVLGFVDEDVLVPERTAPTRKRTPKRLEYPKQKGVIFDVELRGLFFVEAVHPGAPCVRVVVFDRFFVRRQYARGVTAAPGVRPFDLFVRENIRGPAVEGMRQPLPVGQQVGPGRDDVACSQSPAIANAAQRMPGASRELLSVPVPILKPLREHLETHPQRLGGGSAPEFWSLERCLRLDRWPRKARPRPSR